MEHVNGWCFSDIYKGGLWDEDLYVCALKRVSPVLGFVNENANGTLFRSFVSYFTFHCNSFSRTRVSCN